jgi:hypothetical protein
LLLVEVSVRVKDRRGVSPCVLLVRVYDPSLIHELFVRNAQIRLCSDGGQTS